MLFARESGAGYLFAPLFAASVLPAFLEANSRLLEPLRAGIGVLAVPIYSVAQAPHAARAYGERLMASEDQVTALLELFPILSRLRMLRHWAGIVDICPDASPIISLTPIKGFYVNGGWGTGGWKATPGSGHVFASTIARDEPHPLAAPFSLERFSSGALVAEHGAAAVAH